MSKQSLVSKQQNMPNLPAVFDQASNIESTALVSPYVKFISTKSQDYGDLVQQIPGLKEPNAVLIRPAPHRPVKVDPFTFFYVSGHQYWAVIENDGNHSSVSHDRRGKPYTECIETILLVVHNNELTPARCTFRSVKCQAAQQADATLREAASEEWANRGEEYKQSMVAPKAFMRFTATINCKQRTSKSSGFTYWQATAAIKPTGPNEFSLLSKWFGREENQAEFNKVHDSWKYRVDEIKGKMK